MTEMKHAQIDPDAHLDSERFLDYEPKVKASPLIPHTLDVIDEQHKRICDVGGASGMFLDEVMTRSPVALEATVMEVSETYRDKLLSDKIGFLHASILDNDIADDSFDIVTFRDMLHHLVGDTVGGTLANQRRAFDELLRIVRPGGYLIFEEEANNVRLFSRIVYAMSRFANRHRVRCRFFEAGTVIVSFMTPREIRDILAERTDSFGLEILVSSVTPQPMPLRWRLTVLMGSVAYATYVIRVNKGTPGSSRP